MRARTRLTPNSRSKSSEARQQQRELWNQGDVSLESDAHARESLFTPQTPELVEYLVGC